MADDAWKRRAGVRPGLCAGAHVGSGCIVCIGVSRIRGACRAPSRNSIDAAALHAFSILRARHPGIPVCVVGESVGSGPASVLANAPQPPEKIVLVTPFDTLYRVAARRFFFLPVWLLLLDRWDNVYALKDYRGEIEIYGAEGDTVIPVHHARQLSEACANGTFHMIPGGHNDWSSCAAVRIER